MKTLTRLRLINWHRFQNETIEFQDAVLLSGENGAGKSTILDAIQYVITCSKANFNKAAHQEKGERNLTGYIRCKTGREDRPFERTGELSAHIALEFFDQARNAPFILGVVMDSSTEDQEPKVAWYLMEKQSLSDRFFFMGKRSKVSVPSGRPISGRSNSSLQRSGKQRNLYCSVSDESKTSFSR